jgi:hypothetical protein
MFDVPEERGGCPSLGAIALMGWLVVVVVEESLQGFLKLMTPGEVLPPESDSPVFVKDGALKALDNPLVQA